MFIFVINMICISKYQDMYSNNAPLHSYRGATQHMIIYNGPKGLHLPKSSVNFPTLSQFVDYYRYESRMYARMMILDF